jgi:hypothetical protein
MVMLQEFTFNMDAVELEREVFAELHGRVHEQARSIARARGSANITRDDVAEALRQALRLFLDERLAPMDETRRKGAVGLVESWLTDKSGYDQHAWPALSWSIERNRLSDRSRVL